MDTVVYDGSFEGWLTAVFAIYEKKLTAVNMYARQRIHSAFGTTYNIATNTAQAARVWKGLQQRLLPQSVQQLQYAFLSEVRGIENTMLAYVRYIFANKLPVERNYANPAILLIVQTARKVHREKHRMEAFVRFQQAKDGLQYAMISPEYNILPLLARHFKERYANQRWMLYDFRRKYGIYYDGQKTAMVEMNVTEQVRKNAGSIHIYDAQELLCQQYLRGMNMTAHKNSCLYVQQLPQQQGKNFY
jgi:probable DNA metabolism protein